MIKSGRIPSDVKGISSSLMINPHVPFCPAREANLSPMEDYLTNEFLNDLDIFDYGSFVSQYGYLESELKPEPKQPNAAIEVYCMEYDPNFKKNRFDCAICMDTHLERKCVVLNCNHKFCYECISLYLRHTKTKRNGDPTCSLCRAPFKTMEIADYNNLIIITEILDR